MSVARPLTLSGLNLSLYRDRLWLRPRDMGVRSAPASPATRPSSCDRTPRASSITALLQAPQGATQRFQVFPTHAEGSDSVRCSKALHSAGMLASMLRYGGQSTTGVEGHARSSSVCGERVPHGLPCPVQCQAHLFMHWMPIFSLTMPPSLASSTASVSVSASTFFFRNFFKPEGAARQCQCTAGRPTPPTDRSAARCGCV